MDLVQIFKSIKDLWEEKPGLVLVLALGFLIFAYLVVDAWYLKRHRKRRH